MATENNCYTVGSKLNHYKKQLGGQTASDRFVNWAPECSLDQSQNKHLRTKLARGTASQLKHRRLEKNTSLLACNVWAQRETLRAAVFAQNVCTHELDEAKHFFP